MKAMSDTAPGVRDFEFLYGENWPFECGLETMAVRKAIPDRAASF
ncbi:MAG TPA: hypothetical protein VFG91_03490 [Woeseiaceae bacterium]|nr:hypothetical protein [Woeseiaceae bacterium]